MINGLPSDLAYTDNYINTERGLVRGGRAVWNADGESADTQNALANISYTENEENVERGIIQGGAAVWNADGESNEKKRGKILFKRLNLINEFMVRGRGKNIPFGAFLKKKGLNEKIFLSELPSDLQFVGISNETPQSEKLLAYGMAMNKEYGRQYHLHIINTDTGSDTQSCDGCGGKCSASADGAGAAKIKCSTKFPPPRVKKSVKDAYDKCVKDEAVKIVDKRQEKKEAGVGGLGNVLGVVNKTNPALVLTRNGFLGLTSLNALNLAKNMAAIESTHGDHWNKIVKKWVILGGDLGAIKKAISSGKNKRPIFAKKNHGADGWSNAEGDIAALAGLTAAVTLVNPAAGAWTAGASGTIASVLPIIDSYKKMRGEKLSVEENPALPEIADPELKQALDAVDAEKVTPAIDGGFMDKYKNYIIGSLVLIAAISVMAVTLGGGKEKLRNIA